MHNDLMLPISQVGLFCGRHVDGKVCIGDTSLRKYMPKYIKPMSKRNNITCGHKTCIRAILLQSDLNKLWLSQLAKLDKLYINSVPNRIFQRYKINFIEYKNQIFPNHSHIFKGLGFWVIVSLSLSN